MERKHVTTFGAARVTKEAARDNIDAEAWTPIVMEYAAGAVPLTGTVQFEPLIGVVASWIRQLLFAKSIGSTASLLVGVVTANHLLSLARRSHR